MRGGTSRGSCTPHGTPRPTFASVMAKRACSAATQRSHIIASRKPPAYATPFTAAIVGFVDLDVATEVRHEVGGRHLAASVSAISLRSPPAQNARSPAPVSTSTGRSRRR